MVEPSRVFCDWASTLLGIGSGQVRAVSPGSTESEWRIPLPHLPSQPYFESVQAADIRKRVGTPDGISISCATAETLPRPDASFDLAVSLNVIDRHPSPRALIRQVAELVRPGGLMVLGTPFDFRVQFTPDRASWPRQVEELLPSGWNVIGGSELAYHLRLHQWDYTTFVCRIICATAPLGGPAGGHAANDR
jgi:SAM-dependent methyltransferase